MHKFTDPRYPSLPEEPVRKGFMTEEHTVWCGECLRWNQYQGSRSEVTKQAKRYGWRNTRARGWLCSFCIAKGAGI